MTLRSPSCSLPALLLASLALVACGDPSPVDSDAAALVPNDGAGGETPLPGNGAPPPADEPAPPIDPNALPVITSGEGITVLDVVRVSARTFDIRLSTPHIGDAATSIGNGVRITLPPDYATSGKRYPVVYDLHGAGGQSYTWHWWDGQLEEIASGPNADVIIVMPDGGKNGFYVDWSDNSIPQNWETYHLTQLVPFIDRNLRTINERSGRGIIGTSMGGYGASHYATSRPDLFGALATVSGADNSESLAVQTVVISMSIAMKLSPFGAFGPPGPLNPKWAEENPVRHAGALAGMPTFLYVGNAGENPIASLAAVGAAVVNQVSVGLNQALDIFGVRQVFTNVAAALQLPSLPPAKTDIAGAVAGPITESAVRDATVGFHHALAAAGVGHELEIITPQETPFGYCTADHGWPCLKLEFSKALPKVLGALGGAR